MTFPILQFTPTAITQAVPAMVTIPNHGFSNGDQIVATQFVTLHSPRPTGMTGLNGRTFMVMYVTTNTFLLYDVLGAPIDTRGELPFISSGNAQFTLAGPSLFIQNTATYPTP